MTVIRCIKLSVISTFTIIPSFLAWENGSAQSPPNTLVTSITKIGGNGVGAYVGNSGLALNASLNNYIADQFNSRTRKVVSRGIILTLAKTGTAAIDVEVGVCE